ELATALDFLAHARALPGEYPDSFPTACSITVYDPVPLRVVRVANIERAQLLVESSNRPALQAFLTAWSYALGDIARRFRVRYNLEVDPLEI
ncbi:MAG: primosomal protein N', partial [Pollutimonas bauzanensis]